LQGKANRRAALGNAGDEAFDFTAAAKATVSDTACLSRLRVARS
jgi:hypothetical protein